MALFIDQSYIIYTVKSSTFHAIRKLEVWHKRKITNKLLVFKLHSCEIVQFTAGVCRLQSGSSIKRVVEASFYTLNLRRSRHGHLENTCRDWNLNKCYKIVLHVC